MSTLSIDDIIEFAKKNNQEYVSLVDINSMYGTIEFYNKAIANKLKPIIGLQINYENQKIVLIALNNDGYHTLVKISSLIMSDQSFELKDYLSSLAIICEDIDQIS